MASLIAAAGTSAARIAFLEWLDTFGHRAPSTLAPVPVAGGVLSPRDLMIALDDSAAELPAVYCRQLGLAAGSTYADAVAVARRGASSLGQSFYTAGGAHEGGGLAVLDVLAEVVHGEGLHLAFAHQDEDGTTRLSVVLSDEACRLLVAAAGAYLFGPSSHERKAVSHVR